MDDTEDGSRSSADSITTIYGRILLLSTDATAGLQAVDPGNRYSNHYH